jgi:hypothetical protein
MGQASFNHGNKNNVQYRRKRDKRGQGDQTGWIRRQDGARGNSSIRSKERGREARHNLGKPYTHRQSPFTTILQNITEPFVTDIVWNPTLCAHQLCSAPVAKADGRSWEELGCPIATLYTGR